MVLPPGCSASQYVAGESIQVTASPAEGWMVGGWSGTVDDESVLLGNAVSMPAMNHTVTVYYSNSIFSDGFESGDTSSWSGASGESEFE